MGSYGIIIHRLVNLTVPRSEVKDVDLPHTEIRFNANRIQPAICDTRFVSDAPSLRGRIAMDLKPAKGLVDRHQL